MRTCTLTRRVGTDPDLALRVITDLPRLPDPSYAEWVWTVAPTSEGCEISVSWQLHPATFWRRALLARIRQRQLRRTEVPASLTALQAALETTVARG